MLPAAIAELHAGLSQCMIADRQPILKRLQRLEKKLQGNSADQRELQQLRQTLDASCQRRAGRARHQPVLDYPGELPIVQARDALMATIAGHPVTVVCGETGSGKTTQLPKICLELGRGTGGMIGHTQPRRIAARSVAARLAQELRSGVGGLVGVHTRFHQRIHADCRVKIMTDGIMLAEIQQDRYLNHYDTLIIDEAHERSLNIDFLLGYLHRLLQRRDDLKVVITSATIDPGRFAAFFHNAPVVEVSGRGYPVEIRYRAQPDPDPLQPDQGLAEAVADGVAELMGRGTGDTLVFLPGERHIKEVAEYLRKRHPPNTEILPLYARLSSAQQDRVFQAHDKRRIVLATNVAETSLTVPGIRYVVDSGLARISRYSYRSKVQGLRIEKISQAAARQRAGRCGRVAAGICLRLYSEEDFNARLEFTEPEITRTNLAAVILRMLVSNLGDVDRFPFMDRPDHRQLKAGFRLLQELEALDGQQRLTNIGRRLAVLPVDPKLGRMVLAAEQNHCLAEVLIIVSALAAPDARERPVDSAQAADEKHLSFRHERSDFLSFLNIWQFYHEQGEKLSQSKLRKLCAQHFLSYTRMREWHDVHRQLLALVKNMGMRVNTAPAGYKEVHCALLAGLLGNVALRKEGREFAGTRGVKLRVFPGSSQANKPPKWIMAAELVQTSHRYARTVAAIQPAWIEAVAGNLLKRSCEDPYWDRQRAGVFAFERVSLYGLPVVARRRVNFGSIDAVAAREWFIRSAMVGGDYSSGAAFIRHNRELGEAIRDLEARARRPDLMADEETVYQFYDQRLPPQVYDGRTFEKWWADESRRRPRLLHLEREFLLRGDISAIGPEHFPDQVVVGELGLPLSYRFEPGHPADGITVGIPIALLNSLSPQPFEWLVPGLLKEKVTALIKLLPKSLRRLFVPLPEFSARCLARLVAGPHSLVEALKNLLEQAANISIPVDAWRLERLPAHLSMNFRVLGADGEVLGEGRDLQALQGHLAHQAGEAFRELPDARLEREDVRRWDFGDLPESVPLKSGGVHHRAYPALVCEGDGLALRMVDSPARAQRAHAAGLLRLFALQAGARLRKLERSLPEIDRMCMSYMPVGNCQDLRRDIVDTVARQALLGEGADVRGQQLFLDRCRDAERALMGIANEVCVWVGDALVQYMLVRKHLHTLTAGQAGGLAEDLEQQLAGLVYPGFVAATPYQWLPQLPRYLQAMVVRMQRAQGNPGRDQQRSQDIAVFLQRFRLLREGAGRGCDAVDQEALEYFRWMLEEFRVSLYAQELRTLIPVSAKRLEKAWLGLHNSRGSGRDA